MQVLSSTKVLVKEELKEVSEHFGLDTTCYRHTAEFLGLGAAKIIVGLFSILKYSLIPSRIFFRNIGMYKNTKRYE